MGINKDARKREVKRLWVMGLTVTEIANILNISRPTIYRYMEELKTDIFNNNEGNFENMALNLISNIDAIIIEYWKTVRNTKVETAKIGALNGLQKAVVEKYKMLQSFGIMPKEAERLILEGNLNIPREVFEEAFKEVQGAKKHERTNKI